MQITPLTRRGLGLAAASAIAASSSVLVLGGIAQAAPAPLPEITFSTDPARATYGATVIDGSFDVQEGYCAIEWTVVGGQGGSSSDGSGDDGTAADEVTGFGPATPGTYTVVAGGLGSPGTPEAGGDGGTGATPGQDGAGAATGGGGGSSQVTGPGGVSITAAGGDGVGVGGAAGGAGGGASGFTPADAEMSVAPTGRLGTGLVEATLLPCQVDEAAPAPGVPDDVTVADGDGETLVRFAQTFGDGETTSNPESYEYRVDGGPWLPATTEWDEAYQRVAFLVTGLENGGAYDIQVRALNHEGLAGQPTEPVTARPYVAAGPPTAVTATPGVASVRVDWDPVADPGTYGVDHYEVDLVYSGNGTSGRENVCQTTDVFSCLIGLDTEVGFAYSVVVTSVDDHGHHGADSVVVPVGDPAAPAVPGSVPASDGTIVRADGGTGSVPAGSSVTLSGDGYLIGSTVTVAIYSTPQVLGHTTADVNGHWELTVALPAGLANGTHTLVASGVDADGNPRYLTLPVTVTGGAAAPAAGGSSGGATGGATGGSSGGSSGGLAYTGADVALPAIGGLTALALGGGLVLAGRRKRAAAAAE